MKYTIIVLTLVFSTTYVTFAHADVADRANVLIEQHIEAIRTKDPDATIAAWKELQNDPAALKFIQNNHRAVYAYLKLKELAFRLEKLQKKRGADYEYISPLQKSAERIGTANTPGGLRGNRPNNSFAHRFPNQNRVRNQDNRISNSRISRTNRDTVRSFSNQDRAHSQSNQRRIRDRR